MLIHKLTDVQIRKAAYPNTKSLSDGKGLSVELNKNGKRFKFRYQRPVNKKINNLVIGHYPATSLKSAREIAQEYRELLARGIDPQYGAKKDSVDFDHIVQLYLKKGKATWKPKHYETTIGRYNNFLKKLFGNRDASSITSHDIYNLLEAVAQSGSYQTAEKISYIISGAFKQAAVIGLVQFNPALGVMSQVTTTTSTRQMPHFNLTRPGEKERFGKFLKDIDSLSRTSLAVKTALTLSPHIFMRTGTLTQLKVADFDQDNRWLMVDSQDMKSNHTDFIVPLSNQAFAMIRKLIEVTAPKEFIFESRAAKSGHITRESISNAKKRLGWSYDDATIHGLRHTATTYLTEKGYDYEVTEMQLHHKLQGVRGVYNKAMHLEKRREMMQDWSDYLDTLKE